MVILDRSCRWLFTVFVKCQPRHSTRKDDQDELHHLLRWIRPEMHNGDVDFLFFAWCCYGDTFIYLQYILYGISMNFMK